MRFCADLSIESGVILSGVGSLKYVRLRLAGGDQFYESPEPHEIVSITGTLSNEGMHVHLSVANRMGQVLGGHLVDGCQVYTTIELVVGELEGLRFGREPDEKTGYRELSVTVVPKN